MKQLTSYIVIIMVIVTLISCEEKIYQVSITGTENGYSYVDLGTSVYWAVANVGTTEPQSVGNRYAWGETETKNKYTSENYKFSGSTNENEGINPITKYNNQDSLTTLLPEDDAATFNMGGKWRTPTIKEWQELRDHCYGYFATYQGVNGYIIIGANGNQMFLPFTSYPNKKHNNRTGIYMTSQLPPLYNNNPQLFYIAIAFGYGYDAPCPHVNAGKHAYIFEEKYQFRTNGIQIRAVCDKK